MDTRDRIARHLRQLAPHVKERETGELLAAAIAEIDRLRKEIINARELVEHWGGYASPYFQEKWDLSGNLERLDAAVHGVEAGMIPPMA